MVMEGLGSDINIVTEATKTMEKHVNSRVQDRALEKVLLVRNYVRAESRGEGFDGGNIRKFLEFGLGGLVLHFR
jgi:hypothetical protein